MEKLENYYKDLPQDFEEKYCINAKKTSVGVVLNAVALVVAVVLVFGIYILKFGFKFSFNMADASYWIALLAFAVSCIAYIILHEVVHGISYKAFTRQKLRFGLTITCAYCGLKEGYVNKKTAICSTLAPFIFFSALLLPFIIFLPQNIWAFMVILLFSMHVSGCVGDLWVAAILIFKFRGKPTLVCDDGPCQRFYTRA